MKNITILAAAIVFFLLGASDISACSCLFDARTPVKKQVKNAYQNSTAVFYGEVTEVTREAEGVIVKIKVEQAWKGQAAVELIVSTAADSAMCGYNFEKGVKYTIYANGEDGKLSVGLCSRTDPSTRDTKYLSKIKKPVILTRKKSKT